ncbi:MAG: hypothetical protein Q8Q94_03315 [bacterium]|nr:hypothetical protein [bacterium]
MERVRVSTESDEYVSLRQEALGLFAQSRQILYITTAFVIVSIGWYAVLTAPPIIPLGAFVCFLYAVLDVSGVAYVVNTNQAYCIGGYLAVFWESHDPDVRLTWHRMNRLGPSGGFLPNAATFVYAVDVGVVLAFFIIGVEARLTRPYSVMFAPVVVVGIIEFVVALRLGAYLRRLRDGFEVEWRRIKESPTQMLRVHGRYEIVTSRIIVP